MWEAAETLARKVHDEFRVEDPWEDEIADLLKIGVDDCEPTSFVPTKALFAHLGMYLSHTSNAQNQRLNAIMTRLGYEKGQRRIKGATVRGYFHTGSSTL